MEIKHIIFIFLIFLLLKTINSTSHFGGSQCILSIKNRTNKYIGIMLLTSPNIINSPSPNKIKINNTMIPYYIYDNNGNLACFAISDINQTNITYYYSTNKMIPDNVKQYFEGSVLRGGNVNSKNKFIGYMNSNISYNDVKNIEGYGIFIYCLDTYNHLVKHISDYDFSKMINNTVNQITVYENKVDIKATL